MPETKFEPTDLPEIKINLAEAEEDLPAEDSPSIETAASQEQITAELENDKEEKMPAEPIDGVSEVANSDGGSAVLSSLGMKSSTYIDWTRVFLF
jgi:hypothetical protein